MSEDECIAILNIALKRSKEYFEKIGAHILLGNTEQQAIETILDLYKKTKYELEGKAALVDTMSGNEEVLTRNYEILEEKLKQEKEKNKELLKDNNVLNRLVYFNKNITFPYEIELTSTNEFVSKDKIREVLEKYKYTEIVDTMKIIEFYKAIQELLKEE